MTTIRLNVVIAIVSKAWEDSVKNTEEVFWKSRIDTLFQHSFFHEFFSAFGHSNLFQRVDEHDIDKSNIFQHNDSSAKDHDSSAKKSFWNIVLKIIASIYNIFLFVLGLLTLGLFWPTKLRNRILSAGIKYT